MSKIDYRIYRRFKWIIYGIIVVLLFLVGAKGLSAGGATRWINIAGFNFQPSELAKLGLIIFFASLLADIKEKNKIRHFGWGLIFPLVFLLPVIVAIYILQNHFSATFIICAITGVQMLVAGTRISHFILLGGIALSAVVAFLGIKNGNTTATGGKKSFRVSRIQTWLNPWTDITGEGWQIIQSLYAIGSGGLFGAGLGQSKNIYICQNHKMTLYLLF